MGTLLVLGTGQVGTFAARAAAQRGACVVAADLCPTPAFYARFGPREGGDLLQLDILDRAAVRSAIATHDVDRIVLAVGTRDLRYLWTIHVQGVRNVGEVAVEMGIHRLVFLSSFAVYGQPEAERIAETAPLLPRSDYGRAKVAAEEILLRFRDEGLDVRILRPCGLYGPHLPGSGSRSAVMLDELLARCLSGTELSLDGPPGGIDEHLYVKDLGHAVALAALAAPFPGGTVFNVGTGSATTVLGLCEALRHAVPDAHLTYRPTNGGGRSAVPLEVDRIRTALGFTTRYDLASGLADYVRDMEASSQ